MNQPVDNRQETIEKVRDLIKGIDVAMLTTVTDEGLVSRPMKTQEVEFDGDLWFLTKKDTSKYDEIKHNQEVNVAYVDKSYVSIRGNAEIVTDRDKVKQFWTVAHEKFLQTTSDDPNVILIKINTHTAEYWETGNWVKVVKHFVQRMAGKDPENAELNKTVQL
ncbi:pyridoxamine 5'-phosphate oxidase family protein [Paenibacillus sp. NFR01]|uniref:pyridoxamine 5'-phosphate oxidase family protein n=1 Tax=Paenibacillus sp. NFR01 TaxID=1566279 RepID=UPI0008B9D1E8|nr:pyridoxamine 5'-phosphate oxidase family protein [Paenibacillus sp. NFR01]SEU26344.1 General stress protein 26 [Paenibacillus sp. NFR01]